MSQLVGSSIRDQGPLCSLLKSNFSYDFDSANRTRKKESWFSTRMSYVNSLHALWIRITPSRACILNYFSGKVTGFYQAGILKVWTQHRTRYEHFYVSILFLPNTNFMNVRKLCNYLRPLFHFFRGGLRAYGF